MKRFMQLLLAALFITVIAAGCGQKDSDSKAKDNQSETAAKKGETKEKEKELTAEEIIDKSSEAMKDWPGVSYKMNGVSKMHAEKGDEKYDVDQKFDLNADVSMEPIALKMSGTISMADQEIPVNSYYKDKTLYQEAPGEGWIAIEGMDFEALQQNNQAQNPAEQMKLYKDMIKNLESSDKSNEYIKKSEENGQYVISLELNKEALAKVKEQADEIIKQSLGEQLQQLGDVTKDMKYNSMHITFYIDKDTFEQKKTEQKMNISLEQDGATVEVDSDATVTDMKKFEGDITVPEEVKKDAQKITKEQLEQAQQAQQGQ